MHAFVDESYRNRYVLACVVVAPENLRATRAELRRMLLPGQRRLHFHHESPRRRRELLGRLAKLDVTARVYELRARERTARPALLALLVNDLDSLGVTQLVFESRQGLDHLDRQVIAAAQRQGHAPATMSYEHKLPHEEPLLWLPDAVAWAVGAGNPWRERLHPILRGNP